MENISIPESDQELQVQITLKYTGVVNFLYTINSRHKIQYPDHADNPLPAKLVFTIGKCRLLPYPEFRNNQWSFTLINPGNQDLGYEIEIRWFIENPEKPEYIWPVKESDRKGKVSGAPGHKELGGESLYLFNE